MQRPAKPCTPVRFRPQPPRLIHHAGVASQRSRPRCSLRRKPGRWRGPRRPHAWRPAADLAPEPSAAARPGGEIGKRIGLKIQRLRPYGFDSRPGHHCSGASPPYWIAEANATLGRDRFRFIGPPGQESGGACCLAREAPISRRFLRRDVLRFSPAGIGRMSTDGARVPEFSTKLMERAVAGTVPARRECQPCATLPISPVAVAM